MINLICVRFRWYTYERAKPEDKLLCCHAVPYMQTYASSLDVLLQRRPVQQTVEVAVIKAAELISWINK